MIPKEKIQAEINQFYSVLEDLLKKESSRTVTLSEKKDIALRYWELSEIQRKLNDLAEEINTNLSESEIPPQPLLTTVTTSAHLVFFNYHNYHLITSHRNYGYDDEMWGSSLDMKLDGNNAYHNRLLMFINSGYLPEIVRSREACSVFKKWSKNLPVILYDGTPPFQPNPIN